MSAPERTRDHLITRPLKKLLKLNSRWVDGWATVLSCYDCNQERCNITQLVQVKKRLQGLMSLHWKSDRSFLRYTNSLLNKFLRNLRRFAKLIRKIRKQIIDKLPEQVSNICLNEIDYLFDMGGLMKVHFPIAIINKSDIL